uniref:Uncharacterized protein n=1 Tax=Chromera velia CCMP2878 TaxID=1169474 RepID=A0A0K6S6L8_9ALVE|eukprot:Cvel_17539.t2-p1 / transcript=Cvel_17539.t2 / gene=Cvel_17539 / organism=Chromera_velia_CCMP2878 / gene_product=hypothetical protein / transcript_product=hypothetical protein / location=Cvel_scaffold1407:12706-14544(-) / protein_length=405 / sequence_SO=supercontig / SO=protein_coding / is_pseudo=false
MHACNRLEGFCLASLLILAPIVCGLSGTLDDGLSCLPRNSPCADVRTPACGFHPWTEWASDPQDPLYKARTRKPFPTPCHCTSPTETEEDEGGETCETEERLYVEPQSPLGRWSCLSSPLSRRSSVSFASSASKDAVGAAALDCSDESVDFLNVFTREGSEGFLSRAPDVLSLRTDGYSEGERGTGCVPASLVTPSTFVPWAVFHEPRARFVNANGTETVVRGAIQCPSSLESVYWCPPKERGLDVFLSREGKGHMGWGWDSPTVFAVVGSAFARRDPNVVPFGLYPFDSKTCDVRNRETGLGCYPGSGNNETWAQEFACSRREGGRGEVEDGVCLTSLKTNCECNSQMEEGEWLRWIRHLQTYANARHHPKRDIKTYKLASCWFRLSKARSMVRSLDEMRRDQR